MNDEEIVEKWEKWKKEVVDGVTNKECSDDYVYGKLISFARQSEREKIIEELKKEKLWLENARLKPAINQINKALIDIDKFILKLEQQLKPDEKEVKSNESDKG